MPAIVPKSKAPGVDFCGVDEYYYIVRSDLGCYMRSTNFNEGKDLNVYSLHPFCQGREHYLAHEADLFFIIKGETYRRVSSMNTDTDAVVHNLHPNCQGGDHYLSAFGYFYIVFQSKGVYRRVTCLNTDSDAVEYSLHPSCRDGLYYWGIKGHYYFVKPHDQWGIQYYQTTNFNAIEDDETYSFHPDVLNFLPGGLAITQGSAFGTWEAIKTISNDSNTPITWNKKITRKGGLCQGENEQHRAQLEREHLSIKTVRSPHQSHCQVPVLPHYSIRREKRQHGEGELERGHRRGRVCQPDPAAKREDLHMAVPAGPGQEKRLVLP